jgi:hypothetical protein
VKAKNLFTRFCVRGGVGERTQLSLRCAVVVVVVVVVEEVVVVVVVIVFVVLLLW